VPRHAEATLEVGEAARTEKRVAEALHFANRGYVLEAGRVVLEGSHDELRSNDRIRQAYLGM
jgi:branched-chain amino acid transport system ATP-binding protein